MRRAPYVTLKPIYTYLFIAILFGCLILGVSAFTRDGRAAKETVKRTHQLDPVSALPNSSKPALTNPLGVVDGAKNPELIPDHAAYMMIFRLIASATTEKDRNRIKNYIRELGPGRDSSTDADVDALMTVAQEFQNEVGVLDEQVQQIKDRYWPNPSPEVMAKLDQLQNQFDLILQEKIALLGQRLTAGGFNQLQHQVKERVKRKMKFSPEPSTPPGGPGWMPQVEHQQHQ